jgi:HSP20 family protein
MDLHEDKDKNLVTAHFEFPGVSKDEVQIEVHQNRLTVSAEARESSDVDENGYAVRERRYGKFSRTLQLPEGVKVCSDIIRYLVLAYFFFLIGK